MDFGKQLLYEDATFSLYPGTRYGILGANGSGKSTLMKLIIGETTPTGGSVNVSKDVGIGYLEQDHYKYGAMNLKDVLLSGDKELYAALQEKNELLEKEHTDTAGERLAELEMIIADRDGYTADLEIIEILEGLGIYKDPDTTMMSELSGGYRLRVLLGRCLFSKPAVMLLDEPTNHLDIHTIEWLENHLLNYRGLLLLISHDRHFISRVCNHFLDIDYFQIRSYPGDYKYFQETKNLKVEQIDKENEKKEKRADELKKFITKYSAKATKARQANSKKKLLDKLEPEELLISTRQYPNFRFAQSKPTGKRVLKTENLTMAYGEKKLFENLNLDISRGDKLAIIGENGIGKSTLLKILVGEIKALSGGFEWGHNAEFSYFSQETKSQLDLSKTAYEWLHDLFPTETISAVRGKMGEMLFSGDDVHKKISVLSGGEAARLLMAKILLEKSNILILDEPTNHLDIESMEMLLNGLKKFEGTVLFVSHDRFFTDELSTRVLEIKTDGVYPYFGNYSEYLDSQLKKGQVNVIRQSEKPESDKKNDNKISYEARKQQNKLKTKMSKMESKIESAQEELEKIESQLADLYAEGNSESGRELKSKADKYREELDTYWSQLEIIQSELDSLTH